MNGLDPFWPVDGFKSDRTRKIFDASLLAMTTSAESQLRVFFDRIRAHAGSPIEEMLGGAYVGHLLANAAFDSVVVSDMGIPESAGPVRWMLETSSHPASRLNRWSLDAVVPQFQFDEGRVDFLLIRYRRGDDATEMVRCPLVIVECDGHDFHERTREQAERDRSRDRAFQLNGFVVLRFTGTEIHRDVNACVAQIERALGGSQP